MIENENYIIGTLQCLKNKYYLHSVNKKQTKVYPIDCENIEFINKNSITSQHLLKAKLCTLNNDETRLKIIGILDQEKLRQLSNIAIESLKLPNQFQTTIYEELDKTPNDISNDNRENLVHIPLVTIDDESAKDFDDAIYAEPDNDEKNPGGWKILVAIADVAHYVQDNCEIDKEAYKRGTSIYFPDQIIPMLPEKLSNDLCSLLPGKARYCLAVWLNINNNGELINKRFFNGVIPITANNYHYIFAHSLCVIDFTKSVFCANFFQA